jgi:probable rRNA maturation factor
MPVRVRIERGPHAGLVRKEVVRRAGVIFDALALDNAELSIVLTDDLRIRMLNRDYRQKDKPTDVLAFAMREGELGDVGSELLGDVIVSVETARRQAVRAGHDVLSEVTILVVHGVLHLLGWDHDTLAKDRRMRAETARLAGLTAPSVEKANGGNSGIKQPSRRSSPRRHPRG